MSEPTTGNHCEECGRDGSHEDGCALSLWPSGLISDEVMPVVVPAPTCDYCGNRLFRGQYRRHCGNPECDDYDDTSGQR